MDQGSPTNENRIENKKDVGQCLSDGSFFFPSSWKCLHASGSCSFQAGQPRWPTPQKTKEKLPPFLLLLIVHKVLAVMNHFGRDFFFKNEKKEKREKVRNWFSEEAEIFLRFHLRRLKNCVVLRDKKKRKQHWRDLAVEKNHKRLVILPSGLHLLQHNQRFFFSLRFFLSNIMVPKSMTI